MIREKLKHKGMIVDCSGPDGNAFYLLGLAKDLAKRMGWTTKEIDKLMTELQSSCPLHLQKNLRWLDMLPNLQRKLDQNQIYSELRQVIKEPLYQQSHLTDSLGLQ